MALKEPFAVKTVYGDTELSLSAGAGESLLVRNIMIRDPDEDYLTVRTDKTTVGYWRVGGIQGNQLYFPAEDFELPNLMVLLMSAGIFGGYPIAEGETLILSGVQQATSMQVVEYSIFDAADQTPGMPNGSKAAEYFFTSFGRFTGVLADGENRYTVSQTPVEFPAFPFGEIAPQGKIMTLQGIGFTPLGYEESMHDHEQITTFVKLVKEREVLFDEDRDGLPARGFMHASYGEHIYIRSKGVFGSQTELDQRPPLWFDPPLVFAANEELNVYVTTEVLTGTAKIAAAWAELAFLFSVASG